MLFETHAFGRSHEFDYEQTFGSFCAEAPSGRHEYNSEEKGCDGVSMKIWYYRSICEKLPTLSPLSLDRIWFVFWAWFVVFTFCLLVSLPSPPLKSARCAGHHPPTENLPIA